MRPADGVWEEPVDLSAAGQNADVPQVAFDPRGNAIAVWRRYDSAVEFAWGLDLILDGLDRLRRGAPAP